MARRAAAAGFLLLLALLAGPAAMAHPFGLPPVAQIVASGSRVSIHWSAVPDDVVALAASLGLIEAGSKTMSDEQERTLSASEALRSYLLRHIKVVQENAACRGRVAPVARFASEGARVEFECPRPVETVTLRITMLQDLHSAYRTVGIARGDVTPPRTLFTARFPEKQMVFGGGPESRGRYGWGPVAGSAALGASALWLLLFRRGRAR